MKKNNSVHEESLNFHEESVFSYVEWSSVFVSVTTLGVIVGNFSKMLEIPTDVITSLIIISALFWIAAILNKVTLAINELRNVNHSILKIQKELLENTKKQTSENET